MPSPDLPGDDVDDLHDADDDARGRRRGRRRQPDEREREVIRRLATLRDERPSAPNDLVDEILAYVYSQPEVERGVSVRWFVLATVVAVAASAGCVAALLMARRHRELAAAAHGSGAAQGAFTVPRSILHLRPDFRSSVGSGGRRGERGA